MTAKKSWLKQATVNIKETITSFLWPTMVNTTKYKQNYFQKKGETKIFYNLIT